VLSVVAELLVPKVMQQQNVGAVGRSVTLCSIFSTKYTDMTVYCKNWSVWCPDKCSSCPWQMPLDRRLADRHPVGHLTSLVDWLFHAFLH